MLEYYSEGEDMKATGSGLRVTRKYSLLVAKQQHNRVVYQRKPLGREVKVGEEIEVRVTVKADKSYQYLMLEDMLPAGCEIIEDKSDLDDRYRHWWRYSSNREARDEKMVFFNSHLRSGDTTYVYTLRAETPGDYHVMPAQAGLMYQPEVRGTSDELRLSIFE
jgi:uncharacterized protein YfaS (alpha-2-macroglobulin family)